MKNKILNTVLIILGVLLLLNGIGNIIDDARVLTYDLTSIFAGAGIILLTLRK